MCGRIPVVRFLFLVLLILAIGFVACRKQPKGPAAPALIRLDEFIEDPKTEIDSHFTVTANDFEPYQANGWRVDSGLISIVEKRAVFLLPESIWRSRDFRIQFTARSQLSRSLTVQAQGNELARFDLTSDWKEYSLKFTTKDLKKRTLKQLQFLMDGPMQGPNYAEFRSFELPLYSWGRTRLSQDARSAFSVSSNASVRFHLRLPSGKPILFFGIGVPARRGEASEFTYSVSIIDKDETTQLSRKSLRFVPPHTRWTDDSVDLQKYSGDDVILELRTQSTAAQDHFVAWSSPEIYDVQAKREKPNVILFSIDTLRSDRVADRLTPNLAQLASKSLTYTNAFCTFPSTLPSHASIMTGLYVAHHQISRPHLEIIRTKQIPPRMQTMAEMALQAKYFTAGITDGGFVASFFGFDQGFLQYSENLHEGKDVPTIANAIQWLNKNSQRPFFLFLHSYEVHEPFNPPEDVFRKLFPKPALNQPPVIKMELLDKIVSGDVVPTEQQKEFIRQTYDAEVHFFDQNFGRLMAELKRLKLDQNTVILIFSDHGEQFFDRDETFGHGKTLYPEELQVPLILYIPGRKPEQRSDLVSLVDIYPTIAELIGAKMESPVDGVSLLEPSDSKKRFNRAIYYEVMYGNEARWGVQTREFKLVLDKQKGIEYFYDLRKDPQQKNNLSRADTRSRQMMKQLLAAYVQKSTVPTDWAKSGQDEKQETGELREQLKALGYIQ